jgi:outer membrane lipoprotein-sorting protein
MKTFLRLGFAAVALTLYFGAFAAIEINAQNPLPEILKRMDDHYKALKSLKADITRAQYNAQLQETDVSLGKITLIPGKGRNFSLRLDWKKPKEETLSVVNGQYVAYIPNIKRAYTGSSDSKTVNDKGGNVLKIMSMSKEDLKANYNIQFLGQENIIGNVTTWHLKLTPKTATNFKFADLWIDGNGMPVQGKVTRLNNDTDSVALGNLGKNADINGSIFKVTLPKGTEMIKS